MTTEYTPRLWIPGQEHDLADEYPTATQAELTKKWQEYNPDADIVDAPGVYGVMSMPHEAPRAYVSLDVCGVMRDTHLAIRSLIFANEERFNGNIHQYAAGTCLESAADIKNVLRVMMTKGLVNPVPGIEEISDIIEEAADMGAYVFANTSTLPGCELGTIDFFKQHIPVGLQGVAFPRNHDGTLPITKGHVMSNVIQKFPSVIIFLLLKLMIVHIIMLLRA